MKSKFILTGLCLFMTGCGTIDVTARSEKYTTIRRGEVYRLKEVAYTSFTAGDDPKRPPLLCTVSGTFPDGGTEKGRRAAIREIVYEWKGTIYPVGTRFYIGKIYLDRTYGWGDSVCPIGYTSPSLDGMPVNLSIETIRVGKLALPDKRLLERVK